MLDILSKETPFETRSEVALNTKVISILSIRLFLKGSKLGYFDANRFQIGLNKALIYKAKDNILRDILTS
jgi:hypothetical protein